MTYWIEITVAAIIGFALGVILMGTFLGKVRDAELEDRLIRALREQIQRDDLDKMPPPKE